MTSTTLVTKTSSSEPILSRLHYIVALGYIILDRPGNVDDEHYVQIIGNFESADDAKKCVEENAYMIMDNDKQYLTIYEIDLDKCKLRDFYRKDLAHVRSGA